MRTERLSITNQKGNQLRAYLELPENEPSEYVIFAHCFTCSSNLNVVRNITKQLTDYDFGVLRFDFTGLGNSEGEFADSHFSANVQDISDVNQFLTDNYNAPKLLIGHSLGGAAVIAAAAKLDNVKAITTIGTPATVTHVKHLFSHGLHEVQTKGEAEVNIGGRPFKINQEFVNDFDKIDLPKIVNELRKPFLILHSPTDYIVDIKNAEQLYINAKHPKSFISLDNADHLLTKNEDSLYVGKVIGAWAERYVKD